ncbi:MAG: hypothetical protein H5T92_09840 [Synergistales bacterium]|nr:hypothetical protein [Synergistales bacterium]
MTVTKIDNYEGLADGTLRLTATGGLRIWGDRQRNFPLGATVQGTGYNEYQWTIPAGATGERPGAVRSG